MNKNFFGIILVALFSVFVPQESEGRTTNVENDITSDISGNMGGSDNILTYYSPQYNIINIATNGLNLGYFTIYGGYGAGSDGEVSGNRISITASGLIKLGELYGGYGGAIVNDNKLDIKLSNTSWVVDTVAGGYAQYWGIGRVIEVSNNYVFIEGGVIKANYIAGGILESHAQINNNNVQVKNNLIRIYGGEYSMTSLFGASASIYAAIENSINISGNAVFESSSIYGGEGVIANNNTVSIIDGKFNNVKIYGGSSSYNLGVYREASGNTIWIFDGTFSGEIYGGYGNEGPIGETHVKNNIINISGKPNLSNVYLFGGYAKNGVVSGNTLNLKTSITVLSASSFDNYNFYTDGLNLSIPMLTATDSAIDMSDSVIGLYLQAGSPLLKGGDKIFLVENMTGGSLSQASSKMRAGATIIYDWEMLVDGGNLYAVIKNDVVETCETNPDLCDGGGGGGDGGRLNPETKSLLEGHLSSLGVLIQGADLVADSGETLDSMLYEDSNGMFSGINVSSIKLTSGSHVDVQSGSLIIGAGSKVNNYTYGAFLEAGSGKHNTYNEFEDSVVKGNGSNTYAGAGLLGRVGFEYIYFDASIRGGYTMTQYQADYSPDAKYNMGNIYYGGHAGIGLLQNINDDFSLNEYVKYLATMQQGQTVVLDTKEEINFANIMSSRAVAGLRAKYSGVYVGYAYEQELAGEAKATTSNMAIESPVIKGGTSVIEAGYDKSLSLRASRFYESSGFNVGVGGKYYIGVKEGFSINMKIGFMF
ncbi:MAG: hypothetical protein LBQ34_07360 [Alphaproteobacteria bacterium]|jgi:hypothetical protein|nr:hypothetical protein [Alphaproteobacteria bacterium]